MDFPDTTANSIAMLITAMAVASIVGIGIQNVFGRPEEKWAQGLIFAVSYLIGFGLVYGRSFIRGLRGSTDVSEQTVQ